MKTQTKTILVVSVQIQGKMQYVAGGVSKNEHNGKWMVNYTTNAKEAKEFDSPDEADQFITDINNPHQRFYKPTNVQISFETRKDLKHYERIQ